MPFKKTFLMLGFCTVLESASAQEYSKWKDMILRVRGLEEQDVVKINHQLSAFPEIHFSGYVKSMNCILLKYDPDKIKDPAIITTTICYLNCITDMSRVEGVTMYEVIDGKAEN